MLNYSPPKESSTYYFADYFPPREFCTTADMADGQPLPPYIENGIPWRIVWRGGGHTIWVRISMSSSSAPFRHSTLGARIGK